MVQKTQGLILSPIQNDCFFIPSSVLMVYYVCTYTYLKLIKQEANALVCAFNVVEFVFRVSIPLWRREGR